MLPSLLLFASLIIACLARFSPGPKQRKYGRSLAPSIQTKRALSPSLGRRWDIVTPKIFIISMFDSEADVWYDNMPSILAKNITLPGASPLYPDAHCTKSGEVCQLTTGEGEINAASSITALIYSDLFNLTSTYFLVAGIAGINPHVATTGSVTFPRYAVQFDLQYEFDSKQVPTNDSSGYFPQNSFFPDEAAGVDYPGPYGIYGTEAFELNNNLKKRFVHLASIPKLNDTKAAQAYRSTYGYPPANKPPSVVECATGTSNVYFSGSVLGDAFSAYTKLLTNGSGTYCATQQEDNAHLEALLRGTLAGKVDFSRVAIMRTASDFDRAPPGETEVFHLLQVYSAADFRDDLLMCGEQTRYADQQGFDISIENIFIAGNAIVKDVLKNWNSIYKAGIKPENYIGDLFNSLGSANPDIGTESIYIT